MEVASIPYGHTPDRSIDQRFAALELANHIRTYRAQVKRDVKAGRVRVADIIRDPEPRMHTMKLYALLVCVPKYGRVKANRVLKRTRISPSKTLGGLSDRQRGEILAVLR